jgi:catechol 2,3-dioxygenase-like lactoylglutathione lyase family enzyme
MQPRLDLLTLAVSDLDVARKFYIDGLGWSPTLDLPGEIIFLQANHGLMIGLFSARDLAADMEVAPDTVIPGAGFTLAYNVGGEDEVRRMIEQAERAGARIIKPAQRAAFGGFHGYFADPSGIRWEVAWNPGWRVDDEGRVHIEPVDQP